MRQPNRYKITYRILAGCGQGSEVYFGDETIEAETPVTAVVALREHVEAHNYHYDERIDPTIRIERVVLLENEHGEEFEVCEQDYQPTIEQVATELLAACEFVLEYETKGKAPDGRWTMDVCRDVLDKAKACFPQLVKALLVAAVPLSAGYC